MTPFFLADCTVFHMKLIAAHGSMVHAPCPDIAFYIAVAKWTPLNQTFLLHNIILHRKSVPTDRSMVYLPRRNVTGHMLLAYRTNVIIGFLLHHSCQLWGSSPASKAAPHSKLRGALTHAHLRAVDLKPTPLTTRAN